MSTPISVVGLEMSLAHLQPRMYRNNGFKQKPQVVLQALQRLNWVHRAQLLRDAAGNPDPQLP